jgi:hypothetical protein
MRGVNQYAFTLTDEEIAAGVHRERVGRAREYTGKLQQDFLIAQGLRPTSKLLDVGCGALRAGIVLARYLQPGAYYGIDVNESLIRAALTYELPLAGLSDRVPAENRASRTGSSAISGWRSTSSGCACSRCPA